jgi:hypothetical protein
MRKVLLLLIVVILASPVWATINITVEPLGGGVAAIQYSGDQLARAFALDITIDAGVITDVSVEDDKKGDDNGGYGIFPASFSRYIVVLDTGEVESWDISSYTPIADANDPGALGGLGTSGVTIEMGSLYETQAPPLQGTLCTVTCSESCLMSVTTMQRAAMWCSRMQPRRK